MAQNIGRVIVRDFGLDVYIHNVSMLENMMVKAGFPEGQSVAAPEDSKKEGVYAMAEMVLIAMVHEFGLGTAPERSFIRAAIDENYNKIERQKEILFERVASGRMKPKQAMNALGAYAVGIIRKKMTDGPFKDLADDNPRREEGNYTILVDSGQMRQTVQFILTGKGS